MALQNANIIRPLLLVSFRIKFVQMLQLKTVLEDTGRDVLQALEIVVVIVIVIHRGEVLDTEVDVDALRYLDGRVTENVDITA